MSRQILIVGHGYIGAALGRRLAERGDAVTAVNRDPDESAPHPVVQGDVSDRDSLEELRGRLDAAPDAIVHCASSSRGGPDAYRAVFLDGLSHLASVFPETPVFFTSSTSVYGQTGGEVVTESSETAPARETSRILVEAEELARSGGGTALRLAGIYGPGRSVYLQRILDGTAKIEAGPVSRLVNQVHRDDVVGAIVHLIDADPEVTGGETFNVVDDHPMTQRECYQRLAYLLDLAIPPEGSPDPNRKRAITSKAVSNAALEGTGWQPIYSSFFDAVENDPELLPSIREIVSAGQDGQP